ncbi:hypothetical protein GQ473_02315 [archaeon]|nr:hypothetical protein [archaeon]
MNYLKVPLSGMFGFGSDEVLFESRVAVYGTTGKQTEKIGTGYNVMFLKPNKLIDDSKKSYFLVRPNEQTIKTSLFSVVELKKSLTNRFWGELFYLIPNTDVDLCDGVPVTDCIYQNIHLVDNKDITDFKKTRIKPKSPNSFHEINARLTGWYYLV